jgi:hypothetical protein
MKKLSLLLFILSCSFLAFGQEGTDKSREAVKSKTYQIFGNEVLMTKYNDGTKTWDFETKEDQNLHRTKKYNPKTDTGINFDLGINIWVPEGVAPAVKPWGSWSPAINYYYTYKAGNNFKLKSTLGVNWYNFKFEDQNLQALRGSEGILFDTFDGGQGIKSKISASYANISIVPTIQSTNGKLRFGVGPYAGFRMGGRGKIVYYDDNNNRSREIQRANMFANNFRYGGRVEIGVGDVNLFFNYDFNEMFQTNKGPQVNTISFGLTL